MTAKTLLLEVVERLVYRKKYYRAASMSKAACLKTDLDLPPIARTEANLWKAKYFEARLELQKANKGIHRLKKKLSRKNALDNDGEMG